MLVPLPELRRQTPVADLVIFGADGALARERLLPAFFDFLLAGALSPASRVLGIDRTALDREAFRARVRADLRIELRQRSDRRVAEAWIAFEHMLDYLPGDIAEARTYARLAERLGRAGGRRRLFWLAVSPDLAGTVTAGLANRDLAEPEELVRTETLPGLAARHRSASRALSA